MGLYRSVCVSQGPSSTVSVYIRSVYVYLGMCVSGSICVYYRSVCVYLGLYLCVFRSVYLY